MADKFAIITGASTGIGFELAHCAARDGYDLLVVADEPLIDASAADFRQHGVDVKSVEADLATEQGVATLLAAAGGRNIDVLIANAGHGLGKGVLEQSPSDWRHVIDTNITGTLLLVQQVAQAMATRGEGKILFTGSIAGFLPGTYQAVYNGTKAFIDNFAEALRTELKDTGVTVTNLLPGATDTEFFERADMLDTKVGADPKKADPAKVAEDGWKALQAGDAYIVSGLKNKLQVLAAHVLPPSVLAGQHEQMAEPGSAKDE
jgi:uncharacterized protein